MAKQTTAGRTPGEYVMKVGGDNYVLALPIASIMASEREAGQPMGSLLATMAAGGVTETVAVLWGALRTHHTTIDLEGAAGIVERAGLLPTIAALNELVEATSTIATGAAAAASKAKSSKNGRGRFTPPRGATSSRAQ